MYYNEKEARELVTDAARRLAADGMILRTGGSVSARICKNEFIIVPEGRAYDRLVPEDLVKVKADDSSYEGKIKPCSEKAAHSAAYMLRLEASFIIISHMYYTSVISAGCRETGFAPCAGYSPEGTAKLAGKIESCLSANPDSDCILLARHGALVTGKCFEDAADKAQRLEEQCRELAEDGAPLSDDGPVQPFDPDSIDIKVLPCVRIARDQYIMSCCRSGETIGAYIEDFAQAVGPDIKVVDNDAWTVQRALLGYSINRSARLNAGKIPMTGALDRMGGQQPALNLVIGRNAVLVRGVGAVCAGRTEKDADAIAVTVSKNCAAACTARHAEPMNPLDARLQRYIYLTKYSRA